VRRGRTRQTATIQTLVRDETNWYRALSPRVTYASRCSLPRSNQLMPGRAPTIRGYKCPDRRRRVRELGHGQAPGAVGCEDVCTKAPGTFDSYAVFQNLIAGTFILGQYTRPVPGTVHCSESSEKT
jgi:hypothetical protein